MMHNTAKSAKRVLIVDDHPVVVSGCRSLFAADPSVKIDEAARRKVRASGVSEQSRTSPLSTSICPTCRASN